MNNILQEQQIQITARQVANKFFGSFYDERHNFRISEEMAPLTIENLRSIESAANAMPDFIEGSLKLEILALIDDKLRRSSPTFRLIRRLLGIEGIFQEIIEINKAEGIKRDSERDFEQEFKIISQSGQSQKHPFVRLDCIKDAESGTIKIVEIEEAKLHGLGYATLCRMLSDVKVGEGLVNRFVDLTKDNPGLILLANSERFYLMEQLFFAKQVNNSGGNLTIAMQDKIDFTEEGIAIRDEFGRTNKILTNIINLPQFSGNSEHAAKLDKAINSLFLRGVIDIKSFRRSFLGEKSLLALISNPFQDPELEEMLLACFNSTTLEILREMIPKTFMPTSKNQKQNIIEMIRSGKKVFVKVVNASGARGVASFDEPLRQIELIQQGNVIVQEAIQAQQVELPFCDLATLETGVDNHTIRYGSFVFNGNLEEIAATASPSKIAHGGVTSIQTGIKII